MEIRHWKVLQGDCLKVLKKLADNSIDSVVCDPPYHLTSINQRFAKTSQQDATQTSMRARKRSDQFARLSKGFMSELWDGGDIAFQPKLWKEVLRVLKPGGHLFAFGGTRTSHLMVYAIQKAGFEIRDSFIWMYSSGFPKSQNVSKRIDKTMGFKRKKIKIKGNFETGIPNLVGGKDKGNDRPWRQRAAHRGYHLVDSKKPISPEAKKYNGWGTGIKPAHEPICLARKPFSEPTVVKNVLKWGTGALNIGACRIGKSGGTVKDRSDEKSLTHSVGDYLNAQAGKPINKGRWPANLCHDGSEEVLACFPESKSQSGGNRGKSQIWGRAHGDQQRNGHDDSGSAARFFYCGKVTPRERHLGLKGKVGKQFKHDTIFLSKLQTKLCGNKHPTVKPVSLCAWLAKLLTPPGGLVLDPFMGSGTTGIAARILGFRFLGIEQSKSYIKIARQRIAKNQQYKRFLHNHLQQIGLPKDFIPKKVNPFDSKLEGF